MLRALTLLVLACRLCYSPSPVFAADESFTVRRHIAYRGAPNQDSPPQTPRNQLDLYVPVKPVPPGAKRPVVVWIHGGAWKFGDKSLVNEKPQAFTERGFLFVAINYRFVPEVTFREQAADVATAIHWVRTHIAEWDGDPERLFLLGHSAGAHLAALVATDDRYLKATGESLDSVRGVMLLDGAGYDIEPQIRFAGPRLKQAYEEAFGTEPDSWAAASPVHRVQAGKTYPPFLILHVADRFDSKRQSKLLADALMAHGGEARVVPAEDKSHLTINREFGLPDDPPTIEAFRFLDGLQKPRSQSTK